MRTHTSRLQGALLLALTSAMFLLSPSSTRAQQTPTPEQASPAAAPAAPAAPAGPAEQQPGLVIRKESKLVLVDAVVTDKKGNYVHDLTQKDFKVYEDNKEQQVTSFSMGSDVAVQANNA